MIHDKRSCLDKAREAMEEQARGEAEEAREGATEVSEATSAVEVSEIPSGGRPADEVVLTAADKGLVRTGCDQYRQQLKGTISEARKERVCACLEGRCTVVEDAMVCLGRINGNPCPKRLHGRGCAQLSKGFAGLGCFLCADCRVRKMFPGSDPAGAPAAAKDIALTAMLIQMSSGAEATGASYFDYQRMEREFMASIGGLGTVLPSDDADVFIMFMCWVVCCKERALSLDTLFRTAGAVMARTRDNNLTKRADVKAVYAELRQRHGEEATPRTAVTGLMMRHLLETVIPERGGDEVVNARAQLMFGSEVMFGFRVGEALGGGDYHGILANNLVILQRLNALGEPVGEETLEGMLEHSKTKNLRYVNAVARSKGVARVELAKYVRAYWRVAGFTIRTRKEAGFLVTGPDYYVARLSLVALTASMEGDVARLESIHRVLKRSASSEARRWADYSLSRGLQRLKADSFDKKYINLVGGPLGCQDLAEVSREMHMAGLGEAFSIVPGPLMRASHGKMLGLAHMPLQPSSTYDMIHECLPRAYELANADGPDPELDLRGQAAPLWGHHSIRRGADSKARHTMHITGATERDIDMLFGWNEHLYKAMMQLHYESNLERDGRSKVTSMM